MSKKFFPSSFEEDEVFVPRKSNFQLGLTDMGFEFGEEGWVVRWN